MRTLIAIALIAGFVGSALAQGYKPSGGMGRHHRGEKAQRKAVDTAAPVTNQGPLPKTDPWAGVREAPKSK